MIKITNKKIIYSLIGFAIITLSFFLFQNFVFAYGDCEIDNVKVVDKDGHERPKIEPFDVEDDLFLKFDTENCSNKHIEIRLFHRTSSGRFAVSGINWSKPINAYKPSNVFTIENNSVTLKFKAGDLVELEVNSGNPIICGGSSDRCKFFFLIRGIVLRTDGTTALSKPYEKASKNFFVNKNIDGPNYEFNFLSIIGASIVALSYDELQNVIDIATGGVQQVNPNSPCSEQDSEGNWYYDKHCYEFLTPIPGIGEMIPLKDKDGNIVKDSEGNDIMSSVIRNTRVYSFEEYINTIFKILLGLAMVIAVIMIVIGGIMYMTTDAVLGKEDAKKKISDAILGLILALGIVVILQTIDKDLLNISLSSLGRGVNLSDGDIPPVTHIDENGNIIYTDVTTGKEYIHGADWEPEDSNYISIRIPIMSAGLDVNKEECTTVGPEGCTSLFFEQDLAPDIVEKLLEIKNDCKCSFVITGGSEFWLHSTHGAGAMVVDIRSNDDDAADFNKYISGEEEFIGGCKKLKGKDLLNGSGKFIKTAVAEDQSCGADPHWHIVLKK